MSEKELEEGKKKLLETRKKVKENVDEIFGEEGKKDLKKMRK